MIGLGIAAASGSQGLICSPEQVREPLAGGAEAGARGPLAGRPSPPAAAARRRHERVNEPTARTQRMPLEAKVKQLLEKALSRFEDQEARGPRLVDDARRLLGRVQRFLELKLLPEDLDPTPLELACYALQLPMRQSKTLPAGKLGRTNVRDRAEQAAEMLVGLAGPAIDEPLLDHTTQILHELPQRTPTLEEASLLADALNLDDFGIEGILLQTIQLCRTGGGIAQVLDGLEKREQYGYWDARLKEGFHFDPIRQIARQRLEHTRRIAALLLQEMKEDRAV